MLIVLLGTIIATRSHCAQGQVPNLPDDVLARRVKTYTDPLIEQHLPLQIGFAKSVCKLSDEQASALDRAGRAAINRIAEELTLAIRQSQPAKRAQKSVAIGGQGIAASADFDQDAITAPSQFVRRELSQSLRANWPEAWETFDAECQRVEARHKRTAILVQVAAFDDALWLCGGQRKELCELLAQPNNWWQPTIWNQALAAEFQRLQHAVARNSLGSFVIPEPALAKVLHAPQLAIYKASTRPRREDVVIERQLAPLMAEPKAVRLERLGMRQAPRRTFSRPEQRRRLTAYIERHVDRIDAVCSLSELQRDKLLLAGKLDIGQLEERVSPASEASAEEIRIIHEVRVGILEADLPLEIFSHEESHFRRALQAHLLDEQKEGLAVAAKERSEFQRQALVEAVVAGYERSAALTADQCEELSRALHRQLAESDPDTAIDSRIDNLRRIARLPVESFGLCFDFQRTAVKRHREDLGNIPVLRADNRHGPLKQ